MAEVVALGELLVDFTQQAVDGEGYPTLVAHPGGAPANYVAALARYGKNAGLMAKVGDDAFGHRLIATLQKAGVDTRGVLVTPEVFTTLAFVTIDEAGERSFDFARKPGADQLLRPQEVDTALLDEARVFHFGTLSLAQEPARAATQKALAHARATGKWVSFDPNYRPPLWRRTQDAVRQMQWGISRADVVKLSLEELWLLYGAGCDADRGAERLLREYDISLCFITLGAAGCYFANAAGGGFVKNFGPVKTVDTTGAGDIFGASAMFGLLESGKTPAALRPSELRDITAFACAAASLSTEHRGGMPGIRPRREILERMAAAGV